MEFATNQSKNQKKSQIRVFKTPPQYFKKHTNRVLGKTIHGNTIGVTIKKNDHRNCVTKKKQISWQITTTIYILTENLVKNSENLGPSTRVDTAAINGLIYFAILLINLCITIKYIYIYIPIGTPITILIYYDIVYLYR